MKIGLIFPNKDRKDKTVHLGLGYVASYARSLHKDIQISILDTRVATKKESQIFFQTNFDLIGITVFSPVYDEVIEIFNHIRKTHPLTKICLGGAYVTTIMHEIFVDTPADFAVFGEGELTFSDVIFHLKGTLPIENIHGLMFRNAAGNIIINPPRAHIADLDTLPFPAYDLFPMQRYPIHSIATSRGCPYHCAFCNSSSIWQYRWRKRNAQNVVAEMEFLLQNYKHKTFCFSDNSFNIDMQRVDDFCDLLLNKKINVLWSTPVRVENIYPALAHKMKKAGCYNVGIGIESANNAVLAAMGKQTTIEKITESIAIFKQAKIEVLGQFVIGSPSDSLTTVKESLQYAKKSSLDFVMFYSVLPFKGTPQWDYVSKHGMFLFDVIHHYHNVKPRIVFETPEFSYQERLEAINLAKKAGYYSDSNDRSPLFDLGRDTAKRIQNTLPPFISNKIYLLLKNFYRRYLKR